MPPASFVPDVTAGVPSFILKRRNLFANLDLPNTTVTTGTVADSATNFITAARVLA